MTSLISAVVSCSSGAGHRDLDRFRDLAQLQRVVQLQVAPDVDDDAVSARIAAEPRHAHTATSHSPIGSEDMKKRPSASVTRSTVKPLSGCEAVTVAPGNTPPDASRITPLNSPAFIWADAGVATSSAVKITPTAARVLLNSPIR